jgi:hypothetical protein
MWGGTGASAGDISQPITDPMRQRMDARTRTVPTSTIGSTRGPTGTDDRRGVVVRAIQVPVPRATAD